MTRPTTTPDRSDPADARRRTARPHPRQRAATTARSRRSRLVLAGVLAVLAAEPITGEPGATVGAIVGALLLAALAVAVWPSTWSEAEIDAPRAGEHLARTPKRRRPPRRMGALRRLGRGPSRQPIQLMLVRCAPAGPRLAGAPSPYSRQLRQRIDAEDITHAVAAMDALRTEAAELELQAEQRDHQSRLDAIDRAADAAVRAGERRRAARARPTGSRRTPRAGRRRRARPAALVAGARASLSRLLTSTSNRPTRRPSTASARRKGPSRRYCIRLQGWEPLDGGRGSSGRGRIDMAEAGTAAALGRAVEPSSAPTTPQPGGPSIAHVPWRGGIANVPASSASSPP